VAPRILVAAGVLAIGLLVTGCTITHPPSAWDGEPWTNTHAEPCRRYEPITRDWVARHPTHPCAQLQPSSPGPEAVELGPACTQVVGEPMRCSSG